MTLVDLYRSPTTQCHHPMLQPWKQATGQQEAEPRGKPSWPQSQAWPCAFLAYTPLSLEESERQPPRSVMPEPEPGTCSRIVAQLTHSTVSWKVAGCARGSLPTATPHPRGVERASGPTGVSHGQ